MKLYWSQIGIILGLFSCGAQFIHWSFVPRWKHSYYQVALIRLGLMFARLSRALFALVRYLPTEGLHFKETWHHHCSRRPSDPPRDPRNLWVLKRRRRRMAKSQADGLIKQSHTRSWVHIRVTQSDGENSIKATQTLWSANPNRNVCGRLCVWVWACVCVCVFF